MINTSIYKNKYIKNDNKHQHIIKQKEKQQKQQEQHKS